MFTFTGGTPVLPGESFTVGFSMTFTRSSFGSGLAQNPVPVPEPAMIVLFSLCAFAGVRRKGRYMRVTGKE